MNDFIAGGCSGIAQTIIGHPFDTAKVNIQNNISLKTLNTKDLFRGIKYPLLSNALINSVVFSGYQKNKKVLRSLIKENAKEQLECKVIYKKQHYSTYIEYPKIINNINPIINFFSGGIAGLYVAPLIYFFDYGKTLSQMGKNVSLKDYHKLLTREIKPHGLKTTFGREFLAFGVYFSTYDYMRDEYNTELSPLVAGGISGLLNWTTTYNLDVIRNRQIYHKLNFNQAYNMGNLWKGFSFCALRALIVNSLGFYVYELCK